MGDFTHRRKERAFVQRRRPPSRSATLQAERSKKAIQIGTKAHNRQEILKDQKGGGNTRMNPCLNKPNLGTYNRFLKEGAT